MRHLIIGNSAAGIFAAEAIRGQDETAEITILSDEEYSVYSRCLIPYYLAGDCAEEQLAFRDEGYYRKMSIDFRPGERVIDVNPEGKKVLTMSGRSFAYDRLLVATGASPEVSFVHGAECRAVFTGIRTLNDAKAVMRYVKKGESAVIVGAGQVSLKTAFALCKQGMDVTVLSSSPQIFSQSLDEYTSELVEKHMPRHGVNFYKSSDVEEIEERDGAPCAVKTADGSILPASLVIFGKGVRPNVDFLRQSGVALERGVLVDSFLRTSVPDIYAAGDVIESFDLARRSLRVNAIWPNAAEQGRIAGLNMAGSEIPYDGSLAMNSFELFGYSVIAAGFARGTEPDYEVRCQADRAGNYRRLVFQDDILVGYILAGEIKNAGLLTALVRERTPLGGQKQKLLDSRKLTYSLFYEHRAAAI